MNLVEGTRLRGAVHRQQFTEYAMGSALECAACLDIAVLKGFLVQSVAQDQKHSLCEVVKMLAGLRKAWANDELRDERSSYNAGQKLFAHERLEVYQVGLQFIGWFHAQPAGAALSSRLFRQLDKLATSVVLNIAEGNGRYGQKDRRRLLDTAEPSAAKSAAYQDLYLHNEQSPGSASTKCAMKCATKTTNKMCKLQTAGGRPAPRESK